MEPPGAVHASIKSYNNHTGVPLSLARMPADSRYGVFEMGMNHAGELAALTRLVQPNIAVVTWVASVHREFFASEEAIADAKGEIFAGLEPGGIAVIPYDNVHRDRLIEHARPYADRIITFGLGAGADVRAADYAILARLHDRARRAVRRDAAVQDRHGGQALAAQCARCAGRRSRGRAATSRWRGWRSPS